MIDIKNAEVHGFRHAIHAMRNPMDSWEKSDTVITPDGVISMGRDDMTLMRNLCSSGVEHRTFLRFIMVWCDVSAPRYWWTEMDRYTVGKSQVSCSTMHTLHKRPFKASDFSVEHLNGMEANRSLVTILAALNRAREQYIESKQKDDWYTMIQLLPQSYIQERSLCMSYEVLRKIYHERRNHKLGEWHDFCDWVKTLPYAEELICG